MIPCVLFRSGENKSSVDFRRLYRPAFTIIKANSAGR